MREANERAENKRVKVKPGGKTPRLYMQVAEKLLERIRSGAPGPGERLPSERDLAEEYAVSRPTIREAMIALEIAGLVEIRLGSGVYVLPEGNARAPVAEDQGPGPFEILEARRMIEGEVCALAAGRISAPQLQELSALLEEMEQENQREDMTEAADERFHCLIAEASGNSAMAATVQWLWRLRNDSIISTRFHNRVREEGSRPIIADHRAILDALQARDPVAARSAMARHLQRVIDTLMAAA